MLNEPLSRIMRPAPPTVGPATSAAQAERTMRELRCKFLYVVDGGTVLGLVTSRHLMKALLLHPDAGVAESLEVALASRSVEEIMQRNIATLASSATIGDAARELAKGRVEALPVIGDGQVIGIVTATELIDALVGALEQTTATGPQPTSGSATGRQPVGHVDIVAQPLADSDAVTRVGNARLRGRRSSDADTGPQPVGGAASDHARERALRDVYRNALRYLKSGRGDREHLGLVQSLTRARDLMNLADTP